MLLAITFLILVSSLSFDDILGQIYAIYIIAIAGAESAIGLVLLSRALDIGHDYCGQADYTDQPNIVLKTSISLCTERGFLSSKAKDIGTLYLIFALFSVLEGTAFFVLKMVNLGIYLDIRGLLFAYSSDSSSSSSSESSDSEDKDPENLDGELPESSDSEDKDPENLDGELTESEASEDTKDIDMLDGELAETALNKQRAIKDNLEKEYQKLNDKHSKAQDDSDIETENEILPKLEAKHNELAESKNNLSQAVQDFWDNF
ncbi:cytochrome oxidase subunit 1 [Diplocarpon rosae]|nr:cytochrome oxidase subunit 1 [Diplocarpon rosae]